MQVGTLVYFKLLDAFFPIAKTVFGERSFDFFPKTRCFFVLKDTAVETKQFIFFRVPMQPRKSTKPAVMKS